MMTRRRIILLSLAFALFVLWPTINVLRVRHAVASSLRGAASVRLEEFVGQIPLTSVELPRAEWPRVLAALPITPDVGVPGFITFCFVPHHRIVVTDPQGRRFALIVCFGCEQAHTEAMGIFATPYLWRGALRGLFTSHGIRLRPDREYSRAVREHVHNAAPPAKGEPPINQP